MLNGLRLGIATSPPPRTSLRQESSKLLPIIRHRIYEKEYLATLNYNGTAKVWDAGTGEELLDLRTRSGGVFSVAWSPDGKRLATGGIGNTVKIWDAETGKELLTVSEPGRWR